MRTGRTLLAGLAISVCLTAPVAATTDTTQPVPTTTTLGTDFVCWNSAGHPLPQPDGKCPTGWTNTPPTTTTTVPVKVEAAVVVAPTPVVVQPAFTG